MSTSNSKKMNPLHHPNRYCQGRKDAKKRNVKKTKMYPIHSQNGQSRSDEKNLFQATSTNTEHADEAFDSYTKDYIGLSNEYRRMEKYRIHPVKRDTKRQPACIICGRRSVTFNKVFFPCEHRCVCSTCLDKKLPKQCPLCKDAVRIVLPWKINGREHEAYWKWVEEVGTSLAPSIFLCKPEICS